MFLMKNPNGFWLPYSGILKRLHLSSPHITMKKHRAAFTLVELLVVIAIIAILAALLFPAIASSIRKGKMMTAINNTKQVSQRVVSFASDNRDFLPTPNISPSERPGWTSVGNATHDNIWYNALMRYADLPLLKDMVTNPESMYKPSSIFYLPGARYPANKLTRPMFAFSMNRNLGTGSGTTAAQPIKIHTVSRPSVTVFFGETGTEVEKKFATAQVYEAAAMMGPRNFIGRYDGRGVLSFMDGHAEGKRLKDVLTPVGAAITPQRDVIWTPDPASTTVL